MTAAVTERPPAPGPAAAARVLSLCTGYGGLDDAVTVLYRAEVAAVAEIDPAAAEVLAGYYGPGVPNLGDITKIADFAALGLGRIDIVCAGFPCQPVSRAGNRMGDKDERWIWPDVARSVRDLRPRVVVLENVSDLAIRGLDTVTGDLAALGYVGSWVSLRASDVGGAHERERLFIVARPADPVGDPRE